MKRFTIIVFIVSFLILGVAIVSGTNNKDIYALKKAILKTSDDSILYLQPLWFTHAIKNSLIPHNYLISETK